MRTSFWSPEPPLKIIWVLWHVLVIPEPGRRRQADPRDLLHSRPSLVGEFQSNKKPCLKKGGGLYLRIPKVILWSLHSCSHCSSPLHATITSMTMCVRLVITVAPGFSMGKSSGVNVTVITDHFLTRCEACSPEGKLRSGTVNIAKNWGPGNLWVSSSIH